MNRYFLTVVLVLNVSYSVLAAQETKSKIELWNQKKSVTLRGANIWQKAVFSNANPFVYEKMETSHTPDNLKKMRQWNGNYVNISHPGHHHICIRNGTYPVVPEIMTNLKSLIQVCRDNELFAVISFRTGPGRSEEVFPEENKPGRIDYLFQLDPATKKANAKAQAAQDAWVAMWKETAREFKDQPNVVGYDLLVEPFTEWEQKSPTPPEGFQSGKLSTEQKAAWVLFAQRMAGAIREVDKRTPILCGPAPWNSAWALYDFPIQCLSTYEPIVIALHQYDPDGYTHQKRPLAYDPVKHHQRMSDRYEEIKKYVKGMPSAVNEFGMIRWAGATEKPDADRFLQDQLKMLESGKHNHALWLWQVDRINYYDFHFRLGLRRSNITEPAVNDPLVETIKNNWRLNKVFATRDLLERLK